MSIQLANGSTVSIAASYTDAHPFTAISNADPAVATTTGSTYAAGDVVEVTSGWARLSGQLARLSAASETSLTLGGIDTSSTKNYPAGAGAGSTRSVSAWQTISQITGFDSSGGDQQYATYQPLEATQELQIPTVQSAQSITLTIADDPSLPQYQLLAKATDDRQPRAVRVQLPSGAQILYNCYVSMNKTPKLAVNNINTITVSLALSAPITRYSDDGSTT